jgi:hypothetical protein
MEKEETQRSVNCCMEELTVREENTEKEPILFATQQNNNSKGPLPLASNFEGLSLSLLL